MMRQLGQGNFTWVGTMRYGTIGCVIRGGLRASDDA